MIVSLAHSRSRRGGGDDGGRVGARAAGARRLGVARLPHARQPRLAARLPHAAQRALRAPLARAQPPAAGAPRAARAQPARLARRPALPLLGAHDCVARRLPGAAPHLVRVAAVVRADAARAEPGGVVPGVLAAAHPASPHGGQPQRAAAPVHRVAVQPRRAALASYV